MRAVDSRNGLMFEERLEQHGVPAEYAGSILDLLREIVPGPTTAVPTAGELAFVRAAGYTDDVFSAEAANENALYEAASAVALDDELTASLLTTNAVASLMGKDPAHVRRMLSEGRLMSAGQVDGQSAYPAWQFVAGRPLPGLRELLAAFPGDYHPLDVQAVMTAPTEELGGRSPQQWLASGGQLNPVIELVTDLSYL